MSQLNYEQVENNQAILWDTLQHVGWSQNLFIYQELWKKSTLFIIFFEGFPKMLHCFFIFMQNDTNFAELMTITKERLLILNNKKKEVNDGSAIV